jgi:hypothetical protein
MIFRKLTKLKKNKEPEVKLRKIYPKISHRRNKNELEV